MWKLLTDENDKKTKNKKKTKKDIKQAPYVVMSGIGQGAMQQAKGQSIEKGRSREGETEECWSSSQIRLIWPYTGGVHVQPETKSQQEVIWT